MAISNINYKFNEEAGVNLYEELACSSLDEVSMMKYRAISKECHNSGKHFKFSEVDTATMLLCR